MSRYVLVVPLKPPSKNDLRPDLHVTMRGRRPIPTAWLRYEGMRRAWDKAIRPAAPHERASGPRRLRFTRLMGPRERSMDEWNLVGGLNLVVVDLLVEKGWLIGDARGQVLQSAPIERRATVTDPVDSTPATVIEIEDV